MTAARKLKESTVFELLKSAQNVIRTEANALAKLASNIPLEFDQAVKMLAECRGSVIVTGIGKAGWIAQKISASFASTGTRSHYLHPSEALDEPTSDRLSPGKIARIIFDERQRDQ